MNKVRSDKNKKTKDNNHIEFGKTGITFESIVPIFEKKESKTYWNEAVGAIQKKNYDKAIQLYYKILDLEPDHPVILTNVGFSFSQMKKYSDSIKWYEQALKIDSKNPTILTNLGMAWSKLGKYDMAISYYDEALKTNPIHQIALYNKACSNSMKGEIGIALELLEKVIEFNPRWKMEALKDEDFINMRDTDLFKQIVD
jgi:tetratricopeptide (TPR) repeat protein